MTLNFLRLEAILYILFLISFSSCQNRNRSESTGSKESLIDSEKFNIKSSSKVNNVSEVHVYFENSGSMQGYVGMGAVDFKALLFDVYNGLSADFGGPSKVKLFFINNNKIHGTGTEAMDFLSSINSSTFSGGTSMIENMLSTIIDSTNSNVLSVFVSDAIFSLGSGKDALTELAEVKGKIKDKVQEKIRISKNKNTDFGVRIYKYMLSFNGTYFNRKDIPIPLPNVKRPLYFIALGSTDLLKKIKYNEDLIFTNKNNGRKQCVEMNNTDYTNFFSFEKNDAYVTLLGSTYKKGIYKTRKLGDRLVEINGLRASRNTDSVTFQTAIAIDLQSIPVDEDYKLDKNNYRINNSDGYEINDIIPFTDKDLSPKDAELFKNNTATHVFVISSNEKAFPPIELEMIRKTPENFTSSYGSTSEDDNVHNNLDKTFGLRYLVEGFDEALSWDAKQGGKENLYFSITIPIVAEPTSTGGWVIGLIILAIIGFGIFMYLKNRKR